MHLQVVKVQLSNVLSVDGGVGKTVEDNHAHQTQIYIKKCDKSGYFTFSIHHSQLFFFIHGGQTNEYND